MPDLTRRKFLSENFSTISSFGVGAAFVSLGSRFNLGENPKRASQLIEVKDETTGLPLLRLPEGFRYMSMGWSGDKFSDGSVIPEKHDGMGVVSVDGDLVTICRNHEVSGDGPFVPIKNGTPYDPMARGGCANLVFDTKNEVLTKSWMSMSGTSRNCAGGVTPWGTWLTCEETVLGPNDIDTYNDNKVCRFRKTHGWIFEVPAEGAGEPVPLRDMGRFVHEAVAIDQETGIVYETEDKDTSSFYRFIPNVKNQLAKGGKLQVAEVVGQHDLRGGFEQGVEFDVRWHTIPNPQLANTPGIEANDELGVFKQGQKLGGSIFKRLEGCWFGNGLIYFDATDGGAKKAGQIWQYDPKSDKLKLLFESPSKQVLNMPDNLCVSPRGGILMCEDNNYGGNEHPQRVFGLSQKGELSLFAENNVILKKEKNNFEGDFRIREWAGATFSPDGKWLFINIQTPGMTLAITGPWEETIL